MIRVGIVEDDARARKLLADYFATYQEQEGESFSIEMFSDGVDIVSRYQPRFDLLLLDIEMPQLDGMTAAKRIRAVDDAVVIVFVTNSPQHAISGYQVGALSYLLKPLPYFSFAQEIKRSIAMVHRRSEHDVVIPMGTTVRRFEARGIIYIESVRHRITIHTVEEPISFTGALKDIEAVVADYGFFRSNNSYLVNLEHVMGVDDQDAVMSDGTRLRISRPRRRAFLEALTNYIDGPTR